MNVKKICQYCGNEYYVGKSQENRSKFCSDKCFRASKNKQIEYICDYCGKQFMVRKAKVDKLKNGLINGLYCCSQCAKDVQKPNWGDIVHLFKERDYELISDKYINAKTKLEYICNKHRDKGMQSITYNNLKNGCGCKYCGDERTVNAKKLSFEEVRNIFNNTNKILLDQPYVNAHTPLAYICKNHQEIGVQYMTTENARKQFCPYCNVIKGENKIIQYFTDNNIAFERYKTYEGLLGIKGGKLSYDFYLPEYNLLIEFQGEQHEYPVKHFGGEEQFKTQLEHDKRKNDYAFNHNIELLEIWYYDFNNIESILNNKLNK